ncbi:MAG TPA: hypothetical protein VD794_08870 [Flavisolibacter sp.]|nr:hypothetical protein [Flavisolibacter sp.]
MPLKGIKTLVNDLNTLLASGRVILAIEKYYHPMVSLQKVFLPFTYMKALCFKDECQFINDMYDRQLDKVVDISAGNIFSFVSRRYDYQCSNWMPGSFVEFSIQLWENGKIINEQHTTLN